MLMFCCKLLQNNKQHKKTDNYNYIHQDYLCHIKID